MKRSGGVTASAIIAFIGSALLVVLAGLTVVGFLMSRTVAVQPLPGRPAPPLPPLALGIVLALFYALLAAAGIVSGIGLLKLKSWARICFVAFSGLLTFGSLCVALVFAALMVISPKVFSNVQNAPPGVFAAVFLVFLLIALAFSALGIVWLVFFNRAAVKAQFSGEGEFVALSNGMPVSISIIGWLMLASLLGVPFSLLSTYPALVFGLLVWGWSARLFYIAFAAINIWAGVGLLRRQASAINVAIAAYVFGLLNVLCSVGFGSGAEMATLLANRSGNVSMDPALMNTFLRLGSVVGIVGYGIILWLLISRRQAFLEACEQQAQPVSV